MDKENRSRAERSPPQKVAAPKTRVKPTRATATAGSQADPSQADPATAGSQADPATDSVVPSTSHVRAVAPVPRLAWLITFRCCVRVGGGGSVAPGESII